MSGEKNALHLEPIAVAVVVSRPQAQCTLIHATVWSEITSMRCHNLDKVSRLRLSDRCQRQLWHLKA